jgi:regulator of sigma E protease
MRYLQQIITTIGASEDTLQVTVTRDGETRQLSVLPNENNQIGIAFQSDLTKQFEIDRFEYNLVESLGEGVHRSNETVTSIIQGFSKMFSGDISVRDNLGGPVAIASFTKDATDTGGAIGFWTIVAYLSITLAIINILPIPVLDGGHLMFLIYEGITRREPSPKVRMALQQIGFLIIIAIFIFVTFNDIIRQFG